MPPASSRGGGRLEPSHPTTNGHQPNRQARATVASPPGDRSPASCTRLHRAIVQSTMSRLDRPVAPSPRTSMPISALREQVCRANRDLVAAGLVTLSFGNASGVDREAGVMVIKPSGVAYAGLRPEDMVVVRLADGEIVE